MARTTFVENGDGVHVEHGEFTLCGDSFDIGSTEGEEAGDTRPTTRRRVTCVRCAAIVLMVRGVQVSAAAAAAAEHQ